MVEQFAVRQKGERKQEGQIDNERSWAYVLRTLSSEQKAAIRLRELCVPYFIEMMLDCKRFTTLLEDCGTAEWCKFILGSN